MSPKTLIETKGPAKFGRCKLCDKQRGLVNSHVVPRAFFEPDVDSKLLSNVAGAFPKRAPIGVYDRIVCLDCELSFSAYDTYAIKILHQRLNEHQRVVVSKRLAALVVHSLNYQLLKLFTISLLWRASVSTNPFFANVQLGSFEARAREMLLAKNAGDPNEFASWWSVFDLDWTPGVMDPFSERWSGVNAYRFYLGRVIGYLKVDRKPVPAAFKEIAIWPTKPLILVARDFHKSKDLRAMHAVLRDIRNAGHKPF